jgi:hypothetical protein
MTEFSTALYYFLSTVAQTFGAAIALLGALVLFRLQQTTAESHDSSAFLVETFNKNHDEKVRLQERLWAGDYPWLMGYYLTGEGKRGPGAAATYFSARAALERSVRLQQHIEHRFKNAMALTLVLVVGSIVAIPLVPVISRRAWAGIALVAAVLAIISRCWGMYVRLVRAVLNRQANDGG